jgi:predicted Zn-dependent protease
MRPFCLMFALLGACAHGSQHAIAPSAAALYAEGMAQAQAGDFARAEQYLASAQRAGHDEQATSRALVAVCVRASRLRSALLYGRAALAHHPDDLALGRLVASLHWALGEPAAARDELTRILARAPDDPASHYLLALALDNAAEARNHYARYLALDPEGNHAEEARAALTTADTTRSRCAGHPDRGRTTCVRSPPRAAPRH